MNAISSIQVRIDATRIYDGEIKAIYMMGCVSVTSGHVIQREIVG